ncbi:hypothetical protein ACGFY7_21760 [Streptomyces prunicolor]|uniref:hypothetical protein n=1 Tax=Streptomyces prunicolor TaxID=67348 RepID=UPI0037114D30
MGLLHDPAAVHHRDAVGESCHHRQVVADQEQRGALAPEFGQQGQHLGLHGDVACGGRLVGDQ